MSALGRTAALAASTLLVLLTTGAAEPGVRPGTAEGAELVKTGWWWVANDTPLDSTAAAPPQPSPPNVPKGALPVSAAAGEPEKLSALEFKLDGKPGGFVESAVLVLRENASLGATMNAEAAKIIACPVTEGFWADGAAAAWTARPAYDCDLASAAGERDAGTGLWTFDLTAVAAQWLAEGHTGSTSVALVEGADAPESFHVSFDGPALEGVGHRFVLDDPVAEPATVTGGVGRSGGGSTATGVSSSGAGSLGSGASSAAPLAGPPDVAPAGPPVEEQAAAAPQDLTVTPASAPYAAPPWYSGIPAGGYALVVLALALAYLVMLALGPDAQPAAGPTQHGVGRALERLRDAARSTVAKRSQ
jgi:hypothetical protein